MTDLSVLIPARNEMFLARTIEDVLSNIEGDTEVIAVLDGAWADPVISDHERLTLVYEPVSIGQRAATNEAARISTAKYVMKLDAHCAMDKGFDVKMIDAMQDDWAMVPVMRNLHVFDWVCKCGERRYQGKTPTGCDKCDNTTEFERDVVWIAKTNPASTSYCFDPEPHFQYFGEYKKRPEGKGDLTETMSLQGSCWMITRDKYHELNVCDEAFGSWGSQGIELACKLWLSGGKVMVNHNTWYAHLFRTKGGDFGFPYKLSGNQTARAKAGVRDLFFNDKWPQQIRPLSWLVERFWPVRGWTEQDLADLKGTVVDTKPSTKGIVYYTDNRLDAQIMATAQAQLEATGLPIVSVSLEPIDFGQNVVLTEERGALTMFRQILAGLEASDTDVVFFCEHDVLYHPSHFEFTPERNDVFYYNENIWKVDYKTGRALFYYAKQTSGLCAHRELLLEHYRKRVETVTRDGFSRRMGFEPGTHGRPERVDDYKSEAWMSEYPNLDIRHEQNFTQTRWRKDQFRNQKFTKGWVEAEEIPGWGRTLGRMEDILHGMPS